MVPTVSLVRKSPRMVFTLGSILLLPWAWAAFVMPLWALGLCGALRVVGLVAAVRLIVAPMFARRRAREESLTSEQLMTMRAPPMPGVIRLAHQTRPGELGVTR